MAVALGGTAAVLPATTASAVTPKASSSKVLPIGAFNEIVADGAHKHLFISDRTDGKLLVTDYAGATVALLDVPSSAGLLVNGDRLYVAAPASSSIIVYDTATLAPVAAYALAGQPDRLAYAAGKIWFSYGAGDLGSIDLAAAEVVYLTAESGDWTNIYDLSGAADRLVVAGKAAGSNEVAVLDATGEAPDVLAERTFTNRLGLDTALTPDGSGVVVVPSEFSEVPAVQLRTSDLTQTAGYAVGSLPKGVAVAADGTVVIGDPFGADPSGLDYFPAGGAVRRVGLYNGLTGGDQIAGFALEPGGTRAFGIVANVVGTPVISLQVFDQPAKTTLKGSITVESNPVLAGSSYAVMVDFSTEAAIGRPVEIVRSDGLRVGPTTIPDGVFQFTDKAPAAAGTLTYRLTVPADADINAFTSSATVSVVTPRTTTLTLDHQGAVYNYGTTVTFTVHLGSSYTNRTVAIYADPFGADQGKRLLVSKKADAKGNVTVALRLTRNTVVSAAFTGDAWTKPASAAVTVYTRVSVSTAVSKYYKKSGSTYIFHKTTNPVLTTTMTAFPKRKQYLTVEYYSGGKWRVAKAGYYTMAVTFTGTHKIGVKYRVRAAYVGGKSGDTINATTYGAYRYFTFTK
ncbi:hypothetical protein Ato02nite_096440 [Paractinoplanes toevensis]|uniref:Ig-like domain repeat protein n=1 Tax=Paractinoplanes toevensis TaxID=571911 RepID=A0A919WCX0_9ACTN|nr:hypothetical protein Ato02nite_096440 [Actinoplanes toevensis]